MKIRTLTPATVIASLALLFSLTGTAVAGALITGASVKNHSIAGIDIAYGSLTTKHVKDGSLLPKDFKAGSLLTGPQGLQGPAGPPGPPGAQGNAGQNGVSGFEVVYENSLNNSDTQKSVLATCPAGKKVVAGGGYAWGGTFPDQVAIVASFPTGSHWRVVAHELDAYAGAWFLRAYAICATA